MGWAKIEIEFQPETLDPNEVMAHLLEHFRTPEGVPTVNATLVAFGDELVDESSSNRVMGASDPLKGALHLSAIYGTGKKIQAIKDMRVRYGIGLKEAKDYIDDAYRQLGL